MIIGFHGPAFSGKDTAASSIKELHKDTDIFAFAQPLKEASKILFNFTNDQLYDPVIKEKMDERWNKSPRQILQWLGTDVLRKHINEEFFIMNMKQRIANSKAKYIVISDVRFPNEAEFVRSLGGKVIQITRSNSKTTEHNTHITEQCLPSELIDMVVLNDGTKEEFQHKIKQLQI